MTITVRIGDVVLYTLTTVDAAQINQRRADAKQNQGEMRARRPRFQAHVGETVYGHQFFPMVVTRVLAGGLVNGQVLLDGSDSFWVRSAPSGLMAGGWHFNSSDGS